MNKLLRKIFKDNISGEYCAKLMSLSHTKNSEHKREYADEILCEFLCEIGYDTVADIYRNVVEQ